MISRNSVSGFVDRLSALNEAATELVIDDIFGMELPEEFDAIVLPNSTTAPGGFDQGRSKRRLSDGQVYYFIRVRPIVSNSFVLTDPFQKMPKREAMNIINQHPMGFMIKGGQQPVPGDLYSCRLFNLKNKIGIEILDKKSDLNKSLIESDGSTYAGYNFSGDDSNINRGLGGNGNQASVCPAQDGAIFTGKEKDINNPQTHWNFHVDSPPSDWDIVNFEPKDVISHHKGETQVVANKKTLRALDKAASRAQQMQHPPIKLTHQVQTWKNGGYRSPQRNSDVGGADSSRHMYGDAYDISIVGFNAQQIINLKANLYAVGFRGFGHGTSTVHADTSYKRRWPYGGVKMPPWDNFDGNQC